MAYIRPIIDESKFISNPLAGADFKILINKLTDNNTFVNDGENWLPNELSLEKETITKLYVKAENRLIISKLSSKAQRLYIWLTYELEYSKDYLWINRKRYMSENDISSINTFKDAVEELCRYLIIYPTLEGKKDFYWINPRLFFCGDRVKKYPNHVKQYEPKYERK